MLCYCTCLALSRSSTDRVRHKCLLSLYDPRKKRKAEEDGFHKPPAGILSFVTAKQCAIKGFDVLRQRALEGH